MNRQQNFTPQGPVAYTSQHGEASPTGATPPPQRRSWFARHKILTALLVIVVVIVLATALGGGGEEDAPAGAPVTDQPAVADADAGADADDDAAPADADDDAAAEPADAPAEAGIGDPVRDGKFEFTVTEVETGVAEVGDEFLSEEAQGQFVLVHMTVSNIGDEAQMLHGDNQTLLDTEGREHSANTSAAIYLDGAETFLNDINPGNSVDATVVFDIPADAEPAAIELHDSMFSGGVTVSLEG